ILRELNYLRDSSAFNALVKRAPSPEDDQFIWRLLEPLYACEVVTRVGYVVGDGARFVCNIHSLWSGHRPCVYYGFGVGADVSFELALSKQASCEMHVFDPTPSVVQRGGERWYTNLGAQF